MGLKVGAAQYAIRNTQYAEAAKGSAIRKALQNTQWLNTLRMTYIALRGLRVLLFCVLHYSPPLSLCAADT